MKPFKKPFTALLPKSEIEELENMIYHTLKKSQRNDSIKKTKLREKILKKKPFLHCCSQKQLPKVLEKHFSKENEIILLEIDEKKLESEMLYEASNRSGELFPHVYGPINKSAIEHEYTITKNQKGSFDLPWDSSL